MTGKTHDHEEKFDALIEGFIERGADQVTPQAFLQVMTDVAEQRSQHEVELSGRVVTGATELPIEKYFEAQAQMCEMPQYSTAASAAALICFALITAA